MTVLFIAFVVAVGWVTFAVAWEHMRQRRRDRADFERDIDDQR